MNFGKLILLTMIMFVSLLTSGQLFASEKRDTIQLSDELTVQEVQDKVFVITHSFPWPANSLFVISGKKSGVLIDTPYDDGATKLLLDWITTQFGELSITAINTGFHNDNLGGNGFLQKNNIRIYGSHLTPVLLKERSEKTRDDILKWLRKPEQKKYFTAHSNATYIPPTILLELPTSHPVKFPHGEIELYYPGPSHTEDNFVVYFPQRKLLFGGCIIKSAKSRKLGYLGDADIYNWAKAVEILLNRYQEAKVVIPGHGQHGGVELLEHTLSLLKKDAA